MSMTAALAPAPPPEQSLPDAAPRPYHWTVEQFYRAMEAQVFEHPERLELIQGRIIENMGQSPFHSSMTAHLAQMLRAALTARCSIREEKPIRIASDGEPEPDIAVVKGTEDDYWERHPTPEDVVLLVEIADTSAAYDTGDKALLYAQAGIGDYWVVLRSPRELIVHRQPGEGGYAIITRFSAGDTVTLLAAPEIALSVGQMLNS